MPAIVDTGPLVAFFDRSERHHSWVAERIEQLEAPLLLCEPVLTEAIYLLNYELRRFQPRHLGVEVESQLGGFLLGQPAGHVRKDRPVKQDLVRLPRKLCGRAGFGQNLVQPRADLVRIGPIGRRGRIGSE